MSRFVKTFQEAKDSMNITIPKGQFTPLGPTVVFRVRHNGMFGTLYHICEWLDDVDRRRLTEDDGSGVVFDKDGNFVQDMSPLGVQNLKDEAEYILWFFD